MPDDGNRDQLRVAANQARFRAVNEAIERGHTAGAGLIGFVCECGRLGCTDVVELTAEEYEEVRRSPRRFLIVDGHQLPVDETVERRARFTIVGKIGQGGDLVARLAERDGDSPRRERR